MSQEPPILLGAGDGRAPVGSTVSITDDQMAQVLGDFIVAVLGIPVQRGQSNRLPEPLGPDHVIMTPQRRTMLSTVTHEEDDPNARILRARSTAAQVQLDVYGPNSTDNTQILTTLLRDAYGCEAMEGTGVQPLYCTDGQQMPLVNGEEQYEDRWTIQVTLQITPYVSTPAQFADTVQVIIAGADQTL